MLVKQASFVIDSIDALHVEF